jgi:hypothetical protein
MNTPTRTPPEPGFRQRMADRLVDHPFLSLLVLNPTFPAVLALGLIGALVLGASVRKLWVTTPPGFQPVVKVSLLDRVQAWSLSRSARKLAAAGHAEQASQAWIAAIANNQGDPELIRGYLRHIASLQSPSAATASQCFSQAQWLLALGKTNHTDVGLVAEACNRLAFYEVALDLLEPHQASLTSAEEAIYQKAMFLAGKTDRFAERTARFASRAAPDAELALCTAAYTAGWGAPGATAAARDQLARATEDPVMGLFATRLQLALCLRQLDPEGYAQALRRLQRLAVDRLAEHIRYWQLLITAGQATEARRAAEDYRATPRNAFEVVQWADALVSLGLKDHALSTLQRFAPIHGREKGLGATRLWMRYADLLIQAKAWDDLMVAAAQMRASSRNARDLAGLGDFLEGRALIGQGRPEEASVALSRAAEASFASPETGLEAAELMLRSGHAGLATKLLYRLEPSLKGKSGYWRLVFDAAAAERTDHVLLLHAAQQAYRLDPTNEFLQINYAAALLINRQSPAEASKLTLLFTQQHPESLIAQIDHGFALAQNQRLEEAEALLNSIPRGGLGELEATMYHLCWVQVRFAEQRFAECRQHLALVNTNHLFPVQCRWLEDVRAQLKSGGRGA